MWNKQGCLKIGGFLVLLIGALVSASSYVPLIKEVPICIVQGSGHGSPYQGQTLRLRGIIFADLDTTSRRGFFMQAENCDGDPATSDGIFVYLGTQTDRIRLGDWVEVTGVIQEYYGLTRSDASNGEVNILATGQLLPSITELNPPLNNDQAAVYYEMVEGMYVGLLDGYVVGPTDQDDQSWLVRTDLDIPRVFQDDLAGTGEILCVDDGGLFEISPEVKVGDRVKDILGAMDVVTGEACVQLLSAPKVIQRTMTSLRQDKETQAAFRIATFNLANLFDTVDDPVTEDTILTTAEYHRRLQKLALAIHDRLEEPEILAIQEAENQTVLKDLLAQTEIQAHYQFLWENGPDRRGLDQALLYRAESVQILSFQTRQGCTSLVDGLGPDGNLDVIHPQNTPTCDVNGDGVIEGNRLFSRPPLLVDLEVCPGGCATQPSNLPGVEIELILNHWQSKTEDTKYAAYSLPRRAEQARFVATLAQEIQDAAPGKTVIVLGDLNDEISSSPLMLLTSAGFENLLAGVERFQRYTYIYRGRSQVVDHVLVKLDPRLFPSNVTPLHFNADFPVVFETVNDTLYRSSDHDPVIVEFSYLDQFIYLPIMER